jgi:tripartite ATP-independent transporter DctP family solute receptor
MRKGKVSVVCFVAIAVMVLLTCVAAGPVGAADPEYKFRIGCVTTKQNPVGQGAVRLAEAAEQLSKGRIKVDVFDAGQLGGELDMVSQVRMGILELAIIGSGIVASVEPTFSLTELPFIWKSDVSARKVLDGPIGRKILALLEVKGIKGLAWGEWGFRGILTTKKPLESPKDLKGLKIRVIENPLYIVTLRAFGANAVPMAWPEVYTALDQGTIDGVDTNYAGMYDAKQYEVTKFLAVSDHIYTAVVMLMNLKKFKSLPNDLQQVMLEAGKAAGDRTRETASKANNGAIEFMAKRGLKVTHPARKPFEDLSAGVYKRFSAQVGHDLIDEVIAAQK